MQCEHHAIIHPKCKGTDHIIAVFAPPLPMACPAAPPTHHCHLPQWTQIQVAFTFA